MKFTRLTIAWLFSSLLKTLRKTWLSSRRSLTGGRSGRMVIRVSPISIMSFYISMFWYSAMLFFLFLMSQIIIGLIDRLLPMMSGHRVFLLEGGSPCFQSDSKMLVLMLIPLLVDFQLRPSFFLLSLQHEQMASIPRAMQPFSFGFLCLQSQCRSQKGKMSLFHISSMISLLIVLLNLSQSCYRFFSLLWIRIALRQLIHFPRYLVVLALRSSVRWVVVIEKQSGSNSSGTLFFCMTYEPIPSVRSTMSFMQMKRGDSQFTGGSLTQLIRCSSWLRNTFRCTNFLVLLHTFKKVSPLINSLLISIASPMLETARSFNLPQMVAKQSVSVQNFSLVILSQMWVRYSGLMEGQGLLVLLTNSSQVIFFSCLGL